MKRVTKKILIQMIRVFFFLICCLLPLKANADSVEQYPAAIHIQTNWSSGSVTSEQVIDIAQDLNISIVMFAESALRRWEYTLLPEFGPLIRKSVEEPSVFRMGVKKYFKKVRSLQKKNPNMVLFPGVEAAPYYYWEGNPFEGDLTLRGWHKHLLVFGLEDVKKMESLPIASNPKSRIWKWGNIFWLWPLFTFFFGAWLFSLNTRKQYLKQAGGVIILLSFIPMAMNFPFKDHCFSPMKPNAGVDPYQKFIDAARQKGGLIFWAHPEAGLKTHISDKVSVRTDPYPKMLLQTKDYHGFSIFYEGYREVGGIEGVWDKVLMEYLLGKRKYPVWAIGEIDFHQIKSAIPKKLNEVETVFWLKDLKKRDILTAMKKGSMYARRSTDKGRIRLSRFELISDKGESVKSGETLRVVDKKVTLKVGLENELKGTEAVTVQILKNGKLWKEVEGTLPLQIEVEDEVVGRAYYRLFIKGRYPLLLASNPIFIDN